MGVPPKWLFVAKAAISSGIAGPLWDKPKSATIIVVAYVPFVVFVVVLASSISQDHHWLIDHEVPGENPSWSHHQNRDQIHQYVGRGFCCCWWDEDEDGDCYYYDYDSCYKTPMTIRMTMMMMMMMVMMVMMMMMVMMTMMMTMTMMTTMTTTMMTMTMTMTRMMMMMMMMMMISWLSQVSSPIRKLPCTKAVRVLSTFIIETRPNWALGLHPENQLLNNILKYAFLEQTHLYKPPIPGFCVNLPVLKNMLLLSSRPAPRNSDEGRILWLRRKHELQYEGHRATRFFKLIQWPLFMPYCIPQSGALLKKEPEVKK